MDMYLSDFIEGGLKWDIKKPKRNLKLTEHNTDATLDYGIKQFSINIWKGPLRGYTLGSLKKGSVQDLFDTKVILMRPNIFSKIKN